MCWPPYARAGSRRGNSQGGTAFVDGGPQGGQGTLASRGHTGGPRPPVPMPALGPTRPALALTPPHGSGLLGRLVPHVRRGGQPGGLRGSGPQRQIAEVRQRRQVHWTTRQLTLTPPARSSTDGHLG